MRWISHILTAHIALRSAQVLCIWCLPNTVEATSPEDNVEQGSADAGSSSEATPEPPFSAAALLIGIGKYEHEFRPLSPVVAGDLQAMRDALIELGYAPNSIRLLTNDPALIADTGRTTVYAPVITASAISNEIVDLTSRSKPNSVLVVYLTGHGGIHQRYRYFAASDSRPDNANTFVSIANAVQALDGARQSHKIFIVDACSSRAGLSVGPSASGMPETNVEQLFSSRIEQESRFDKDRSISLFTESLVQSVHELVAANVPRITANDLFDMVEARMSLHWRFKNPSHKKCSEIANVDVDPYAAHLSSPHQAVGNAPPQCPFRVGAPSFSLKAPMANRCDAIRPEESPDASAFMRVYLECLRRERVSLK